MHIFLTDQTNALTYFELSNHDLYCKMKQKVESQIHCLRCLMIKKSLHVYFVFMRLKGIANGVEMRTEKDSLADSTF